MYIEADGARVLLCLICSVLSQACHITAIPCSNGWLLGLIKCYCPDSCVHEMAHISPCYRTRNSNVHQAPVLYHAQLSKERVICVAASCCQSRPNPKLGAQLYLVFVLICLATSCQLYLWHEDAQNSDPASCAWSFDPVPRHLGFDHLQHAPDLVQVLALTAAC